ncbi:hypothetical protein E2C01_012663 [Portunus trituberculatus]|uniref:Uncharacterized protein n=1 Tax=Portunus trituberculatus TaxID=210409 RepID=A0A5B7DEU5_PORTR|nr:hypothetical protein [Portunus trituberculatus]
MENSETESHDTIKVTSMSCTMQGRTASLVQGIDRHSSFQAFIQQLIVTSPGSIHNEHFNIVAAHCRQYITLK